MLWELFKCSNLCWYTIFHAKHLAWSFVRLTSEVIDWYVEQIQHILDSCNQYLRFDIANFDIDIAKSFLCIQYFSYYAYTKAQLFFICTGCIMFAKYYVADAISSYFTRFCCWAVNSGVSFEFHDKYMNIKSFWFENPLNQLASTFGMNYHTYISITQVT